MKRAPRISFLCLSTAVGLFTSTMRSQAAATTFVFDDTPADGTITVTKNGLPATCLTSNTEICRIQVTLNNPAGQTVNKYFFQNDPLAERPESEEFGPGSTDRLSDVLELSFTNGSATLDVAYDSDPIIVISGRNAVAPYGQVDETGSQQFLPLAEGVPSVGTTMINQVTGVPPGFYPAYTLSDGTFLVISAASDIGRAPEPASLALLSVGLLGLGAAIRRRGSSRSR